MLKKALILFGIIYITLAIWGIVLELQGESPHEHGSLLLGTFRLDFVHNLIHLLSGVVALAALVASDQYVRMYFRVFGAIYAVVAIIGFVQGHTVLGLFAVNLPDNLLHVAIAVASLTVGFWPQKSGSTNPPAPAGP